MERLGSLIISCAKMCALPAGGALAVDREQFARLVSSRIQSEQLITVQTGRVQAIPPDGIVVVATGPLTDGSLFRSIEAELGKDMLYFHDAAAPIVLAESIDMDIAFRQSRYGRGDDDYINCPLDRAAYERFQAALVGAERVELPEFERENVFEGCMPIETMARRGPDTIRYGPLKPVGLVDPRTGKRPYACVQLRQDDRAASLYNLVGFQTRLRFPEQQRVFRMIPGLEQAEFARFGVMHRNAFLMSPQLLNPDYSVRKRPSLYFAGQITGVEGYVESASSGLLAGRQAAAQAAGLAVADRLALLPSARTVIGSLAHYVSDARIKNFQPMNANFGLVERDSEQPRRRDEQQAVLIAQSLAEIDQLASIAYNVR
jgi:methylenetetrahydrofolate--tRNA-(uracil-5-)-methyltransferase